MDAQAHMHAYPHKSDFKKPGTLWLGGLTLKDPKATVVALT